MESSNVYLAVWGKCPFFTLFQRRKAVTVRTGAFVCRVGEEDSLPRKIGDRDPYLRPPKNAGQFSIAGFFGD